MRKSNVIFTLICMVIYGCTYAQSDQFVNQVPEKPKAGDEVVITYNALSDNANLKNAKEITLYMLCFYSEIDPTVKELKMSKNNDLWSVNFKLDKELLLLYYFDDGTTQDYNNDEVWFSMVYNLKNQPLPRASFHLGCLYEISGFRDFKFKQSKEKSTECLNKEIALYPGNTDAYDRKWSALINDKPGDESVGMLKKELNKVYPLVKKDEKAVYPLIKWFETTNQAAKGEAIKNSFLKKNPKGYIAQMNSINSINTIYYNTPWDKHSDYDGFIDTCKKELAEFPEINEYDKDRIYGYMVNVYVGNNDLESASDLMKNWKTISSLKYNDLAWALIEKGKNLDLAVKWANEAMKMADNPDITKKPTWMNTKSWKAQNKQSLAMCEDTYAFGLFQLGYTVAAEPYYEKSYNGSNEDVNARYVECLVNNGNYVKAIEISEECLMKSKANEQLLKNYKTAWIKVNGSENGFDAKISQFNSKAKDEAIEKLKKEMLNKPAIDFTLKSLDGKTVKLSDLKGKIVVLDFWATWCGPCRASFPTLQKVTDKYKDNPNIVILTIDTREDLKIEEQISKVKEFIEKHSYTFTVLFDEGFDLKYEVEGIPTKFIIDRYGKIQFKTVGFSGEAKMMTEMEAQFEILLNDDYLQELKNEKK